MSNKKNSHSPLFGITAFLEDLEVVSSGFVFQNQFKSVKFQQPADRFSRRGSQKLLKSFLVRKSFVLDPPTFSDGETNTHDFTSMQNLLDVPQKSGHFMNAMASEKFKDYCWPVLASRRVIENFRSDSDDRKDSEDDDVLFREKYSDLVISQTQWQNRFSVVLPRIEYSGRPSYLVNSLFDSSFFVHCPNNQLMRLSYSRHLEGVLDSICQMVMR
jgi:hypothetical protein